MALAVVAIVMFSVVQTTVFADVVAHPRGPIVIMFGNGEYVDFDVRPEFIDGVVFVPLHNIVEAMGGSIDYVNTVSHRWITIRMPFLTLQNFIILFLVFLVAILLFIIFRKKNLPKESKE